MSAAEVSLRPTSVLVSFDGENAVGMIATYVVGVVIDKQAGSLGGPAKTHIPLGPDDAELTDILARLTARVTARLNEQAGLVKPILRLVDPDESGDDEEL